MDTLSSPPARRRARAWFFWVSVLLASAWLAVSVLVFFGMRIPLTDGRYYWPLGAVLAGMSGLACLVGAGREAPRRWIAIVVTVLTVIALWHTVRIVDATIARRCVDGPYGGIVNPESSQNLDFQFVAIGYEINPLASSVTCWWATAEGVPGGVPWEKPLFQFARGQSPLYP